MSVRFVLLHIGWLLSGLILMQWSRESDPDFVVFFAVGWLVLAWTTARIVLRCPQCGKNAMNPHADPKEHPAFQMIRFYWRPWPERSCSRCGQQLR
jgi:hypothetical protein